MADTPTTELDIKVKPNLDIDKSSVKKEAEKLGETIHDGVEKGVNKGGGFATMWKQMVAQANSQYSAEYKRLMFNASRDFQLASDRKKVGSLTFSKSDWSAMADSIDKSVNGSLSGMNLKNMIQDAIPTLEGFAKVLGGIGTVAKKVGKTLFDFATTPLKSLSKGFLDLTKRAKGFIGSIGRIAVYRAIRAAIKAVAQGFQEGRENAYQWAVVNGNQFAKSMDMIATAMLYVKNSIGAMTMPLTNYLAPIIDRLADGFVNLLNIINQFIATITGASTWVKAIKYPTQYAEAVSGAAKEIKNQLLGFDELNVLNAPSGSGSGSALDYGNMFQEMTLEGLDFAKAIREAIKNGKWDEAGKLLSQKFNLMILRLDAKGISSAIGAKVNNALTLVHTLLNETDFYQVGVKIGEFMSNFKLDWAKISGSWMRWKLNILDTLLGLVRGVNWGNVASAIGSYITGLFNEFSNWLKQVNWTQVGSDIFNAIKTMIENIDWKSLASAIWNAFINALLGGLASAKSFFNSQNINLEYVGGQMQLVTTPGATTTPAIGSGAIGGAVAGAGNSAWIAYQNALSSGNVQLAELIKRQNGFANGGYPQEGSLFYAGEQGAELVAQIGGRTGVMNTDQMADSLASANEGVIEALVSVGNAVVTAINRKDTSVNVNDIRKAINSAGLRYGV